MKPLGEDARKGKEGARAMDPNFKRLQEEVGTVLGDSPALCQYCMDAIKRAYEMGYQRQKNQKEGPWV